MPILALRSTVNRELKEKRRLPTARQQEPNIDIMNLNFGTKAKSKSFEPRFDLKQVVTRREDRKGEWRGLVDGHAGVGMEERVRRTTPPLWTRVDNADQLFDTTTQSV